MKLVNCLYAKNATTFKVVCNEYILQIVMEYNLVQGHNK